MELGKDASCHDVARGELGVFVQGLHKALAGFVDERCAFASECFGGKWCGVAANRDGGGVELHEFGVRNHCACKGGHADAVAARLFRVGRHRIEMADAAGGEHDIAGVVMREVVVFIARGDACHFRAFGEKLFGGDVFIDRDGRRCANRSDEGLHDRGTRHIAPHAHDAALGMGSFARLHEMAFEVFVERHAEA